MTLDFDKLLEASATVSDKFQRKDLHAKANKVEQWAPKKRDYGRQYAGMYWFRLESLKPNLAEKCRAKWPDVPLVDKIGEVKVNVECCVIGTVFCDMPLKPNVLNELAEDKVITIPVVPPKYCGSEQDAYVLEDESGRAALTGEILRREMLATGVVLGVKGHETPSGDFEVSDFCLPGYPDIPERKVLDEEQYVALISGLGACREVAPEIQLLMDFLNGQLGAGTDLQEASKISRVILAGNTFGVSATGDVEAIQRGLDVLDGFVKSVSNMMPIDLMPGPEDPSSYIMPQQPLHKALLPSATAGLASRTNPCALDIEGTQFLGVSGQNIADLERYQETVSALTLADLTLQWRHIAPTAPDTLCCYPYPNEDPFIIAECPHVYFIGNQARFETKLIDAGDGKMVRIVMVPDFTKTKSIVLVNVKTLECSVVSFG